MDLAKAVAVCATHPGPLKTFAAINGGIARITAATAPVIAIATTAGTGSEVGRGAMLILDDGRKVGILSPGVDAHALAHRDKHFQRRIARSGTEASDGSIDPARAFFNRGNRIGDAHAEIMTEMSQDVTRDGVQVHGNGTPAQIGRLCQRILANCN